MIVSIEMNKQEKKLAEAYAQHIGMSLSDAIKITFFEKIEEQYEVALADMALGEYEKDHKTYTHEQIKKLFKI